MRGFIKGNPPPKHKGGCKCFRCSGTAWNKGLKRWWNSPTEFKKGLIPWNKGIKGTHFSPQTEYKKGNVSWSKLNPSKMPHDEKHHMWKGENVGYYALHNWISRKLGKPKKCKICNDEAAKRYEWANISRKYKRELDDWIRLCKSCHERYDKFGLQI